MADGGKSDFGAEFVARLMGLWSWEGLCPAVYKTYIGTYIGYMHIYNWSHTHTSSKFTVVTQ